MATPAVRLTLVALLGPPVAWLAHLLASYALVPAVCQGATVLWLHVVTALALAATLGAALASRRLARRAPTLAEPAAGRARFFARAGLVQSAFFALVILAEALYTFIGDPCAFVFGPLALAALLARLLAPAAHAAVGGPPLTPDQLATAWNPDPLVWASLAALTLAYAAGLVRLRRRAPRLAALARPRQLAFALALLALLTALASPLDALGEALFSAHMAQHLLLTAVAAPLLVLSRAPLAALWALPRAVRHALARLLRARPTRAAWALITTPAVAWLVHVGVLWLWHAPPLYEGALVSAPLHLIEHASFLGSAALFWWVVVRRAGSPRLPHGLALLWVFAAAVQASLLGVLITFSRAPWYPVHAAGAQAFGLSPLADQQLAGLAMWVPGGLTYLAAALLLLRAGLAAADRAPAPSVRHLLAPPHEV